MQEIEKEKGGEPMPSKKPKFDESKLTPRQREAYEIAKAQGVKPITSIKELQLDIEPEEMDRFIEDLEAERRKARLRQPRKSYFE